MPPASAGACPSLSYRIKMVKEVQLAAKNVEGEECPTGLQFGYYRHLPGCF